MEVFVLRNEIRSDIQQVCIKNVPMFGNIEVDILCTIIDWARKRFVSISSLKMHDVLPSCTIILY